ncbi:nucleotide exchange factor GrpE [Thermomonospora umbrina]|nr:nucleotide exchange factor GrpE [Thermomonospora umbrina]
MLLHVSSAQDPPPEEGPVTAGRGGPAEPPGSTQPVRRPEAAHAVGPASRPDAAAHDPSPGPGHGAAGPNGVQGTDGARGLAAEVARLAAAVEREHERAAHRETVIDRLHEDVQTLRRGELQALFEPVRAALFRLHDLTGREARRWADDPPEPANAAALLAAVTDEIAEALARTGVERFTVAPGDPFDPARHRPVATVTVEDPALDGTVVGVRSDGFARADRVVRKAEVQVGRPARPEDEAEPAPLSRSDRADRADR